MTHIARKLYVFMLSLHRHVLLVERNNYTLSDPLHSFGHWCLTSSIDGVIFWIYLILESIFHSHKSYVKRLTKWDYMRDAWQLYFDDIQIYKVLCISMHIIYEALQMCHLHVICFVVVVELPSEEGKLSVSLTHWVTRWTSWFGCTGCFQNDLLYVEW